MYQKDGNRLEGRKKQIMDVMERPLEDKISQDKKQFFIEEMIELRQSIEANRKEVKSLEIQLRNLTS